jgi:hypothetical protein
MHLFRSAKKKQRPAENSPSRQQHSAVANARPAPPPGSSRAISALQSLQQLSSGPARGKPESARSPAYHRASFCFTEARDYYKQNVKSFNKIYIASETPKAQRRLDNANSAHASRLDRNERRDEEKSTVEKGCDLVARGVKDGNCDEMCSVAAYFINRRFPEEELHKVSTRDHSLLVVGEAPPGKPITDWSKHEFNSDSYVLDVWMNIFCETREYESKVRDKLEKWAGEDKLILTLDIPGAVEEITFLGERGHPNKTYGACLPNNQDYIDSILSSTTKIEAARDRPHSDAKNPIGYLLSGYLEIDSD